MNDLALRSVSTITPERFAAVLTSVHAPCAADAILLYHLIESYGINPAVALAFFWHESKCGTEGKARETLSWGNMKNPEGRQCGYVGPFAQYPSWRMGCDDWCDHMIKRYVKQGLVTVEQIVPKYAPSSDGNVPKAYIADVRAKVAQWQEPAMSIPSATGWCPFAAQRINTHAFYSGNTGRKAVVLHVTAGRDSRTWLGGNSPSSSAHFLIGQDGTTTQFVSINDSAWANGLAWVGGQWHDPEDNIVTPPWPELEPGHDPNRYTISIEHEALTGFIPWSQAMDAANTKLLQWIAAQTGIVYVPHHTLIGHCEISPKARANCPGSVVDYQRIANAANGGSPTAPGTALTRWRCVAHPSLRVRVEPRTTAIAVGSIQPDAIVSGILVDGDAPSTEQDATNKWLQMGERRYCWAGLLEQVM